MNYYTRFKAFLNEKFGIDIAEWHSLSIGALTGLIGGPGMFSVVLTTALTWKKAKGHLKDLKKEVGYGLASFSIVEGLQIALGGVL